MLTRKGKSLFSTNASDKRNNLEDQPTELASDENQLVGEWLFDGKTITGNIATARINWLISNHLKKLASANGGWDVLYIDPDDGRLWELTYPQGHMHGGGPPSLTQLSEAEAGTRYNYPK